MHNSIVRHAESESVAIQFSHGLLEFRKRMPSCRQTIIPVELRNPRVRSVAERAGHGTTPTVRGAWDRTMDTGDFCVQWLGMAPGIQGLRPMRSNAWDASSSAAPARRS